MSQINPKADFYFTKENKWQQEIQRLRIIVLGCGLTEEVKWGCPCYTLDGNNVVLIHVFKEYCALLFFKGALINDPENILIQQTENVQSGRQVRFTSEIQVAEMKPVLERYIRQAIAVEKAGLKVEMKKTGAFKVAEEFQHKLDTIPALKEAFEALTPGRQKGYLLYFSQPKQPKTRETRVEKYIPQIINGKGLDD